MKVFKFGGASLENAEAIRRVSDIIADHAGSPLVVVVSAMGKTTNALERVAEHYYRRQRETAAQLWFSIREHHHQVAAALIPDPLHPVYERLRLFFTEMDWYLGERPYHAYDYYYDRIVSAGELLSSMIVEAYLQGLGMPSRWLDVREIICTDQTYRDGRIQWDITQQRMTALVAPLLADHAVVITQGFIGRSEEGATVTLGREGSDYTAAVFANMLDAESLSIWKDVDGLKNADPKLFNDTVNMDSVDYNEVIEMAYYGAQVIHPKTIKPLQNKKIPLYVKCFLDKTLPGTIIGEGNGKGPLPPVIVLKKNQVLLTVTTRDFSFVTEENLSRLYNIFHDLKIKLNLTQSGAISFSCCIDQNAEKVEKLIKTLHRDFTISYHEGLELLTVRHYENGLVGKLIQGKHVLLEQRSPLTMQLVLKN